MRLTACFRNLIWLWAAVFFFGPKAVAQTVPVPPPPSAQAGEKNPALASVEVPKAAGYVDFANGLTVEQLTERALARNPAIEAARRDIERAEGELRQAGYRPNPTFDFERTRNPVSAPENGYVFGVSMPFELGGKRSRRIEVARVEVEIARKRLADAQRLLRAEVATAYGELVTAIANLRFTEEIADLNRESLRVLQARFDEGDVAGLDLSLLIVEINRLETERLAAHQRVTELLQQLRQTAGLDQNEPVLVRGMLDLPAMTVTREGMLLAASLERPDLQAARLGEAKAEATERLQRAGAVPNLNALFRYSLDNAFFDDAFGFNAAGQLVNVRDRDKLLTLGLSLELPFFNRNQGNIAAAGAQIAQARAQRELLEAVVRREVQTAYSRYESATRTLSVFAQYVLPGSQRNLQTIQGAYQAGQLRLLDVLTEQRKLIEVQTAVRTAQLAVFQARSDLERAVGRPIR